MTVVHRSGLRVAGAAADDATRARPIEHHRFRAGDRVVVRPIDDILATLDVDGTLRGLPFMPEMLGLCGESFYVERRAEKTCVDIAPELGVYPHRRFIDNDVVVLSGPRCDGRAHDGCKRACKIFWKEAWLRPFESGDSPAESAASGRAAAGLKTKSDEHRYFCQSTQLRIATEEFPGRKKPWMLRVVVREIHNGDRTVAEIVKLIALSVWQVVMEAVHGKGWLQGPHRETTPAASLGLKPGDKVRIKSRAEMVGTLNQRRRNRGMSTSCSAITRMPAVSSAARAAAPSANRKCATSPNTPPPSMLTPARPSASPISASAPGRFSSAIARSFTPEPRPRDGSARCTNSR